MPVSRKSGPGQQARSLRRLSVFCVAVLIAAVNATAADVDFDKQVAPIFAAHCLECHGGAKPKGGLSLVSVELATKGGETGVAFVAKDSAKSLLWERVSSDEMPPKHPLKADQKAILKKWIDEGAKWGTSPIDLFAFSTSSRAGRDWWSLQPLSKPATPKIEPSYWPRGMVDVFVLQKLQQAGLKPAAAADSRTLIRRLYFDLIGLPPSPEKVAEFVASPSDAAWLKVIDELLASKHYGERWGRHWLDVVRFGESDGFERNFPRKTAWYYRDWIVNSLNNDMPYDEFVRIQLIGDLIKAGPEGAAATGFWVAGVHNTVVGGSRRMKLLARQDEIEEVLATVGQTFVGLTVNCARCHDHKFDPITQKEFYQLSSAISGLGYGERTVKAEFSADDKGNLAAAEKTLSVLPKHLAAIDDTARKEIFEARKKGKVETPDPPAAFARWEFDGNLKDSIGELHGKAVGNAKLENGSLAVDGTSFVETAPLKKDIGEKTLEAWVLLDNLDQRGGASISIETRNGVIFDAIVFGERESKRWMPGSNGFVRTDSFQGPEENEATKVPVHFAIVYTKDGNITGFRNGLKYGQTIRKSGMQNYKAGDTEIVFGLRHKPAGSNKHLTARILQAAFYDRALTAEEVAASAGNSVGYVSEQQLVEYLSEEKRKKREQLKTKIAAATKVRDEINAKATMKIYSLTPGGGATTNVLLRGDPDKLGDVVSPGAVASVPGVNADFSLPPEAPEAERRRKLAAWITHKDNPLFARVIVNRVWHYHFGTGLVDTPNDLGFNGGRPSHPELLEWLAVWFRDNGYSLKKLHRLIVTSRTWQQRGYVKPPARSDDRKNPLDVDADNRLLWKMTPRRLEAESVRDGMLVVSGKLNASMGGPSFEDVSIISNNGTNYYEPKVVEGDVYNRRTIYRFNPRGGRTALLDTFDCPDPAATAPRRAVTTTPLQALSLLNNYFVLQMSDAFSERVKKEAGEDPSAQISRAWQLAVCRKPTNIERELSAKLLKDHGLPALCRGLFNSSEFVVVE
jgi:mono/diheme cytochrome c family protein